MHATNSSHPVQLDRLEDNVDGLLKRWTAGLQAMVQSIVRHTMMESV
jgi:hypothetical protein